eukprot:7875537-Alexandrium_andersonii.AAC.1
MRSWRKRSAASRLRARATRPEVAVSRRWQGQSGFGRSGATAEATKGASHSRPLLTCGAQGTPGGLSTTT